MNKLNAAMKFQMNLRRHRQRKHIKFCLQWIFASVVSYCLCGTAGAEPTIRGLPEPSAQFSEISHDNLRFLVDLGPGYVMAQRISDKKQVIVEISKKELPQIFEIDDATVKQNTYHNAGWRRWWVGANIQSPCDPRDYLLVETFDGPKRGIKNGNGKTILENVYTTVEVDDEFKLVALKNEDEDKHSELFIFTSNGKLIGSWTDILPESCLAQNGLLKITKGIYPAFKNFGLLNTSGKIVCPFILTGCQIQGGVAIAGKVENSIPTGVIIDRNGHELINSTDYNAVQSLFSKIREKWIAEHEARVSSPLRAVDVDSVARIAEADHSTDTEHFSPAVWCESLRPDASRSSMLAGFFQDHKVLGMSKEELSKYLGPATVLDDGPAKRMEYSLNMPECGNACTCVDFRLENNLVNAWRVTSGMELSPWRTDAPPSNGRYW